MQVRTSLPWLDDVPNWIEDVGIKPIQRWLRLEKLPHHVVVPGRRHHPVGSVANIVVQEIRTTVKR
jgi:hypothetical protein